MYGTHKLYCTVYTISFKQSVTDIPLFMFILVLIKLFNRLYVLLIVDRRVTRAHMLIPVSCHYYVHMIKRLALRVPAARHAVYIY